jgi:molybdenum cofactor biosynthesis enzyme
MRNFVNIESRFCKLLIEKGHVFLVRRTAGILGAKTIHENQPIPYFLLSREELWIHLRPLSLRKHTDGIHQA